MLPRLLALVLVAATCAPSSQGADWPTARGDARRSGCVDGMPGPKAPKVLWVHKATGNNYVASPVVANDTLFIAALGAFNTASVSALSLDPGATQRVLWSKSAPLLKLPTVGAPAVVAGQVIFGDGMHQTDGGVLHALRGDTGRMLWQLPLPGALVHLEGAPTIADGKVYLGAGNAGVLCLDTERLTLDGKEIDLAAARTLLDARWKELQAKYEADKKKDPDFAVAPSEDALPRPAPRVVWTKGEGKWHVDAPVAVVGTRVFAASAYLDEEKQGERALLALNRDDGATAWSVTLKLNPWAGPTISGGFALVGCSSIRFDPKLLAFGKGEVVAVDLESGAARWKKSVPGGIVSPLAATESLVVGTATDGKVRAWDLKTGQLKWSYDAHASFFAGPALSADAVYVADLKGSVHALGLADGKPLWTLDLARESGLAGAGKFYGSPVLAGGRLYLATCDLEDAETRAARVVVCLGDR